VLFGIIIIYQSIHVSDDNSQDRISVITRLILSFKQLQPILTFATIIALIIGMYLMSSMQIAFAIIITVLVCSKLKL